MKCLQERLSPEARLAPFQKYQISNVIYKTWLVFGFWIYESN